MASLFRRHNSSAHRTSASYLKNSKPYLNSSLLIVIGIFGIIGASILYRSYASTGEKFTTQSNRVLVELQDGHADGPLAESLAPAEVVNFRLYGNGLAVCGQENSGKYTSQQLNKQALNAFMLKFKKAGFDKVEDNLTDSTDTPITVAAATTIKVNFPKNFRKASYSRSQLVKTPDSIKKAKAAIDDLCQKTTQAYTPDRVVVRTKVTKKPVQTNKTRPVELKKETFKSQTDKQQAGFEVVSGDKTKHVLDQLSISKTQIVKDGNTNYEVITDPVLPDVDESDQVATASPNKVYADSQVPVQILEFFPQGWGPGSGDQARLNDMASAVNGFYRYQIQGSTFNLMPPRLVIGQRDLNYYLNYCGTVEQISGCALGSLDSVLYGIYKTDGVNLGAKGKATIVYLPFQVNDPNACGTTFLPKIRFGVSDHFASRCSNPGSPSAEKANIAHELGHAFSLMHPSNSIINDIMSANPTTRCEFGPPSNCWLNDSSRARLATPEYFQPDPVYTAGMINIHRLYNPGNGKHFYTSNIAEFNSGIPGGWMWESVAWKAYPSAVPGAKQLVRFYNPTTGNRIMTIDEREKTSILAGGGWVAEANPIIYVQPYATSLTPVAVTRLYNPRSGDRIFATDGGEVGNAQASGWVNEGVRFWVQR